MSHLPDWHALSTDEVFSLLRSGASGLTAEKARKRLAKHGPNVLSRERQKRWYDVLADQFRSPLMAVLFVAAGASLALGATVDAAFIAAAMAVSGILGFVQEFHASKAMEQLRSLVRAMVVVRRDGIDSTVPAEEIVAGDIVVVSAGDRIAADMRLTESVACEANEASLTGESASIAKGTDPLMPGAAMADRSNMLFAGTSVVAGRGVGVVVATGARTELGGIARLVAETQERDTPLQIELKRLAKWLSVGVVAAVAVIFVVGIAFGRGSLEMFQMSVALAVAAIPEGLGISVTIVLAIGMRRMSGHNALTRRLIAAETLGSVSVICTDKTGTITEGEMRVDEITGNREKTLEAMMLCNDAVAEDGKARGTPTERALLDASLQAGLHPAELAKRFPRLAERPFDSIRKYMATVHGSDGRAMIIVKGAPERVIPMCRAGDAGRLEEAAALTEGGLRVIAIAVGAGAKGKEAVGRGGARPPTAFDPSTLRPLEISDGDLRNLTFLGFVGLRDPLRKEAAEQIRAAREAGVRTVMVTGDHPNTARAIAEQAGIATKRDAVATGADLDSWDDAELDRRVHSVSVYARVEPRHKIRVVQAWQRRGAVVAVTGDGVNDAPALRAADVGVALGSGTEVAKEASDIVLLDNDLGSITAAIREGRVMFDNMRRSVVYLFTGGFTEIVLIGGALLFGLPLPLLAAQILWINLVTDALPNAALAFEKGEPDIMRIPPRPRGEPVFNRKMAVLLLVIGVVTDVFLFGLYFWVLGTKDVRAAQSFMFAAVGVASVVYVFAIRSFHRSIFRLNPFSNPLLIAAVALSLGLMVLALTFPPLASVLQVAPLALSDWALLLMIGVLKLGVIETAKKFAL